jgi:hypothetical protein
MVDANKGQLNEEEKTFPIEGEDEDDSPSLLQCSQNPWLREEDEDDLLTLATFQNTGENPTIPERGEDTIVPEIGENPIVPAIGKVQLMDHGPKITKEGSCMDEPSFISQICSPSLGLLPHSTQWLLSHSTSWFNP